ncbi:MAG: cytosine permease, partial [Halanaerobiales bacterium]
MSDNESDEEGLIEHGGVELIPPKERTMGFSDLFLIWAGFSVVLTNFMLGSMGVSIGIIPAIIAESIGIAVIAIVAYFGTRMASDHGFTGTVGMKTVFGENGSLIPSIGIWIVGWGWYGVQVGMVGEGFNGLITNVFAGAPSMPKVWMVFWGVAMGIVAIFGVKFIKWLNRLAVPLIAILIGLVLYKILTVYSGEIATFTPSHDLALTTAINLLPGGMA